MKTEVKVYELKFDTTKNPLGEIYLDVSINGPREKGYICEIRNLSQSKDDPDYRMFDIHGNQNFFNCRYTSNDRKDKDLFKVIPMTVKGMEQRIMDNKEQFVEHFLKNEFWCAPFYATFINGENTNLASYLKKDDFSYTSGRQPFVGKLKDILSIYKPENDKLFQTVKEIFLFSFPDTKPYKVLKSHEDIMEVMIIPEFDIKFVTE